MSTPVEDRLPPGLERWGDWIAATIRDRQHPEPLECRGIDGQHATAVAEHVAAGMGCDVRRAHGRGLVKLGDIAGILSALPANSVLFIDGCECLGDELVESLRAAGRDFRIEIPLESQVLTLNLMPFALILAFRPSADEWAKIYAGYADDSTDESSEIARPMSPEDEQAILTAMKMVNKGLAAETEEDAKIRQKHAVAEASARDRIFAMAGIGAGAFTGERDIGATPGVLAEATAMVATWCQGKGAGPMQDYHEKLSIDFVMAVPVYAVACAGTVEMRQMLEFTAPFRGEAAGDFNLNEIDPWAIDVAIPPRMQANGVTQVRIAGCNRVFPCGNCGGQGRARCPQCHGGGQEKHSTCKGSGWKRCGYCSGAGMNKAGTQVTRCSPCAGRGLVVCNCGNGMVACSGCGGGGELVCGTCVGAGALVQYPVVQVERKSEHGESAQPSTMPQRALAGPALVARVPVIGDPAAPAGTEAVIAGIGNPEISRPLMQFIDDRATSLAAMGRVLSFEYSVFKSQGIKLLCSERDGAFGDGVMRFVLWLDDDSVIGDGGSRFKTMARQLWDQAGRLAYQKKHWEVNATLNQARAMTLDRNLQTKMVRLQNDNHRQAIAPIVIAMVATGAGGIVADLTLMDLHRSTVGMVVFSVTAAVVGGIYLAMLIDPPFSIDPFSEGKNRETGEEFLAFRFSPAQKALLGAGHGLLCYGLILGFAAAGIWACGFIASFFPG